MTTKKLIVLDIDHTLLHTWMPEALPPFISADDPHRTAEQRQQYASRLLAEYPHVRTWNDAVICPRPHLDWFIQELLNEPTIDVAIYSTAAPIYITECLSRVAPDLLKHAAFVWGKAQCVKRDKTRVKDLELIAREFGYPIHNIRMVDDLQVVTPEPNRIPIEAFRVDVDLGLALQDTELLRVAVEIKNFFRQP